MTKCELDHLEVAEIDRHLIQRAVRDSPRVFLAPMDKGLSGSAVWQARWILEDNSLSTLNVFKIGRLDKITKEYDAIAKVASAVADMPGVFIEKDEKSDRALLRLRFQGSIAANNSAFSLRNYIRRPYFGSTPETISAVIDSLYKGKMRGWHVGRPDSTKKQTIANEMPRWKAKIDLERAAAEIGRKALDEDLKRSHDGLGVSDLAAFVEQLLAEERDMRLGPIHGDLHAANVNLDEDLNVYLIDYGDTRFGWRALDFIVLEAAIKFAASPNHAPVTALLQCEGDIDEAHAPKDKSESLLYGRDLSKIVAAAKKIRENCHYCSAEPSIENYRAGLICAAASFTSIEWLVNRRFLFHSIAYQCRRVKSLGLAK